jgi:hypothetical protein
MKTSKRILATAIALIAVAGAAQAGPVQITEWMYSGVSGEFIEFTNTGSVAIDLAGWSFSDSGTPAGTVSLSAFGLIAAGESVILTEVPESDFRTAWHLSTTKVIGGNTTNLGRADTINIWDATATLADTLAFNDQATPTKQGPRTQNKSCNIPVSGYGYTVAQSSWVLASVGDVYGSRTSIGGDIASPGTIPEPGTIVSLVGALVGTLGFVRRKR